MLDALAASRRRTTTTSPRCSRRRASRSSSSRGTSCSTPSTAALEAARKSAAMSFDITVSGDGGGRRRRRARAGRRPRRVRHHRPGPDAVGAGRRGRGGQASRLDRGGRRSPGRSSPRSWRCARSSSPTGVNHIVLAGMGGSSLAPEVITRTAGVAAHRARLHRPRPGAGGARATGWRPQTALVVSSKSGSTVETDSQQRVYEQAFRDAGIDPVERIIVVTDPGSPLDAAARAPVTACSTPTRTSAAATRR